MLYFGVGLNFLTAFLSLLIPESPRYLFGMEKYEECRAVFRKLARGNGKGDVELPRFEEEYEICVETATMVEGEMRVSAAASGLPADQDENFKHLLASGRESNGND